MKKHVKNLESLEDRIDVIERCIPYSAVHSCPADPESEEDNKRSKESRLKDSDDDDLDLFGSDSEASERK